MKGKTYQITLKVANQTPVIIKRGLSSAEAAMAANIAASAHPNAKIYVDEED